MEIVLTYLIVIEKSILFYLAYLWMVYLFSNKSVSEQYHLVYKGIGFSILCLCLVSFYNLFVNSYITFGLSILSYHLCIVYVVLIFLKIFSQPKKLLLAVCCFSLLTLFPLSAFFFGSFVDDIYRGLTAAMITAALAHIFIRESTVNKMYDIIFVSLNMIYVFTALDYYLESDTKMVSLGIFIFYIPIILALRNITNRYKRLTKNVSNN